MIGERLTGQENSNERQKGEWRLAKGTGCEAGNVILDIGPTKTVCVNACARLQQVRHQQTASLSTINLIAKLRSRVLSTFRRIAIGSHLSLNPLHSILFFDSIGVCQTK